MSVFFDLEHISTRIFRFDMIYICSVSDFFVSICKHRLMLVVSASVKKKSYIREINNNFDILIYYSYTVELHVKRGVFEIKTLWESKKFN